MIQPAKCPICERPVPDSGEDAKYQPFCCKRCKEIDFFRWCDGKYAITEPVDPFDVPDDVPRVISNDADAE
jgi:uncharacterized protein